MMNRARIALVLLISASSLHAADVTPDPAAKSQELDPTTVVAKRPDYSPDTGEAAAATEGVVPRETLAEKPLRNPGEIMETVPGVVVTQHSGSGKANQYYLRGFNLDHGTDLAIDADGMPVNMPSHGHGQGYADMNFIIPELVGRVDFRKGPYFAENGDFASAGSASLRLGMKPGTGFVTGELGSWLYNRQVLANAFDLQKDGVLTIAFEHVHNDGPWDTPEDFEKLNLFLRYERGDKDQGWSVTAMGYHGDWNSTDQVPDRALGSGLVNRYGSLNPTDGGNSGRYSLQGEFHVRDGSSETLVRAYAFYYDLALFSDFTYFLDDPVNGDQFRQKDNRFVEGADASHRWQMKVGDLKSENLIGISGRSDQIENSLARTKDRRVISGVRADDILESNGALYFQNTTYWSDWFRTIAGVRGDVFIFDVHSDNPANSGNKTAAIASPKVAAVLGPWAKTEFFADVGLGYHSNDARGVMTHFDPSTGTTVSPADPLVRTRGAEIGVRTRAIKGLESSISFWGLDSDSELIFVGDAGTVEPSRPVRRIGIESDNHYALNRYLSLDADASLSHARFRDYDPAGDRVPGAIESVYTFGISVHDFHGFFGGLYGRYFGSRPLIEDDSARSSVAFTLNLTAGYKINKNWSVQGSVFNLLDRRNQDVAYYYESRLPGEAGPVADIHQHPAEPISFRIGVTGRF